VLNYICILRYVTLVIKEGIRALAEFLKETGAYSKKGQLLDDWTLLLYPTLVGDEDIGSVSISFKLVL
jgi:hypothetical protein